MTGNRKCAKIPVEENIMKKEISFVLLVGVLLGACTSVDLKSSSDDRNEKVLALCKKIQAEDSIVSLCWPMMAGRSVGIPDSDGSINWAKTGYLLKIGFVPGTKKDMYESLTEKYKEEFLKIGEKVKFSQSMTWTFHKEFPEYSKKTKAEKEALLNEEGMSKIMKIQEGIKAKKYPTEHLLDGYWYLNCEENKAAMTYVFSVPLETDVAVVGLINSEL